LSAEPRKVRAFRAGRDAGLDGSETGNFVGASYRDLDRRRRHWLWRWRWGDWDSVVQLRERIFRRSRQFAAGFAHPLQSIEHQIESRRKFVRHVAEHLRFWVRSQFV
jgi:hypothetical protein